MKYKTAEEISAVVKSFERGEISRRDWRHAEHLTVALYYVSLHDLETATRKMRDGIFNLLKSFGVDLAKEMPYHETLTVFWMRTIFDFSRSKNGASVLEKTNEMAEKYDKDYPLKFYSRERLFSDEARKNFVEGDL